MKHLLLLAAALTISLQAAAGDYVVTSPDGHLSATVNDDAALSWSIRHDVIIPYLRMLPGPLDYTPGAMRNATRHNFFGNNNNPMSQGTRVHQMAMYVIYEAPLQMLADSPTRYIENEECTALIATVPTIWDETIPLAGEMGEYVAIARRKGTEWYIAALNNWTPRTITLSLDFLTSPVTIETFADGINADREATDYTHSRRTLQPGDTITISLAPGGGWIGRSHTPRPLR